MTIFWLFIHPDQRVKLDILYIVLWTQINTSVYVFVCACVCVCVWYCTNFNINCILILFKMQIFEIWNINEHSSHFKHLTIRSIPINQAFIFIH